MLAKKLASKGEVVVFFFLFMPRWLSTAIPSALQWKGDGFALQS